MNEDWRIVISFRKLSPKSSADPDITADLFPEEEEKPICPRKVTLIAGDSVSYDLDPMKLGRNGRKNVINLSQGGATIKDVEQQLDSFYLSEEFSTNAIHVEKVIVCVGTNDIRPFDKGGVRKLKSPLIRLARHVQLLYPSANVWFQNLVPLPFQHKFTFKNVEDFNKVLYEACTYTKCYVLNVFEQFLTFNPHIGYFRRKESLFKDLKNIHLNRVGVSILARNYLRIIYNSFNPLGY